MIEHTSLELSEAARAITSTLHKSEKAILKLKEASQQYRLSAEAIRAYQIALSLIARELDGKSAPDFSKEEMQQAAKTFSVLFARVEKVLPKFAAGTPQHTLAKRRLRAFEIANLLIRAAIEHRI